MSQIVEPVVAPGEPEADEFNVSLFAACEYGAPAWPIRKAIAFVGYRIGIAVIEATNHVLHPMHPLRIYEEGAAEMNKRMVAATLVSPRRPNRLRDVAWMIVGVLLVIEIIGEFVGFVPSLGVSDLLGSKPFHPLYHFGIENHPRDDSLVALLRN